MKTLIPFSANQSLKGQITVPPDKSIAQRSVIMAALAKGTTYIKNFPQAGDPQSTLMAIESLGLKTHKNINASELKLEGGTIQEPSDILCLGNSGTGFRLILGMLAGLSNFGFASLTGDFSLRNRPMKRVVDPLLSLGAKIYGRNNASRAPLSVIGSKLKGGSINLKVASAQLKSALLLSCLNASEPLLLTEPAPSRNHTEIMLKSFGANLEQIDNLTLKLIPSELKATEISIPGDISSAAFLLVACCLIPNSEITINNVGLNSSRTGILQVLEKMGANLQIKQTSSDGEPIGNIQIKSSKLQGIEIGGALIANIIDEIPILALAASQAKGVTTIKNAEELRVKESDRLKTMYKVLSDLGVKIEEMPDGLIIEGLNQKPFQPKSKLFFANHDHRIAMTVKIASLLCTESIELEGAEWADISFPSFFELIDKLSH